MTSQIGYLKLLITRIILSGPLDFEIQGVACSSFSIFYFNSTDVAASVPVENLSMKI